MQGRTSWNKDRNCLFNAVSEAINKTASGDEIRQQSIQHIVDHPHEYEGFLSDTDMDTYKHTMLKNGSWGGELELHAISNALQIRIQVFRSTGVLIATYTPKNMQDDHSHAL